MPSVEYNRKDNRNDSVYCRDLLLFNDKEEDRENVVGLVVSIFGSEEYCTLVRVDTGEALGNFPVGASLETVEKWLNIDILRHVPSEDLKIVFEFESDMS